MNQLRAAGNNTARAGIQLEQAANQAAAGNAGMANRYANASANNFTKAANQLTGVANAMKQTGNMNAAKKVTNAANAAKRAEAAKALGHIASAINTLSRQNATRPNGQ
jgi:hypothetical protein